MHGSPVYRTSKAGAGAGYGEHCVDYDPISHFISSFLKTVFKIAVESARHDDTLKIPLL